MVVMCLRANHGGAKAARVLAELGAPGAPAEDHPDRFALSHLDTTSGTVMRVFHPFGDAEAFGLCCEAARHEGHDTSVLSSLHRVAPAWWSWFDALDPAPVRQQLLVAATAAEGEHPLHHARGCLRTRLPSAPTARDDAFLRRLWAREHFAPRDAHPVPQPLAWSDPVWLPWCERVRVSQDAHPLPQALALALAAAGLAHRDTTFPDVAEMAAREWELLWSQKQLRRAYAAWELQPWRGEGKRPTGAELHEVLRHRPMELGAGVLCSLVLRHVRRQRGLKAVGAVLMPRTSLTIELRTSADLGDEALPRPFDRLVVLYRDEDRQWRVARLVGPEEPWPVDMV